MEFNFLKKIQSKKGNNLPPEKIDEIRAYAEEIIEEIENFLEKSVDNDEEVAEAGNIERKIRSLLKDANKARLSDSQPYRDATDLVNKTYNDITNMLSDAVKKVKDKTLPYLKEQVRLKEEKEAADRAEAARLQKIADDARREEEEKAKAISDKKSAEDFLKAQAEARNIEAEAVKKEAQAAKEAKKKVKIADSGYYQVEIITASIFDYVEAAKFYSSNQKIKAILDSLATADAKAGVELPFATIGKDKEWRNR